MAECVEELTFDERPRPRRLETIARPAPAISPSACGRGRSRLSRRPRPRGRLIGALEDERTQPRRGDRATNFAPPARRRPSLRRCHRRAARTRRSIPATCVAARTDVGGAAPEEVERHGASADRSLAAACAAARGRARAPEGRACDRLSPRRSHSRGTRDDGLVVRSRDLWQRLGDAGDARFVSTIRRERAAGSTCWRCWRRCRASSG